MKPFSRILLLGCLAALLPAARAEERVVRLDFPVGQGATLKMDTYRGSIDVGVATDGQIHLEAHIDPGVDDPVKRAQMLQRLQFDLKQDGDTISIAQRNPRETGVRFVWDNPANVVLDYSFLVPLNCNLELATSDGAISVGNLKGTITAHSRHGGIFLRRITGDIHAVADGGGIILSHCDGSVVLSAVQGDIHVGTVGGRADLRTTNGDIEVQHVLGGFNAIAEMGDVTAGFPAGFKDDADVKTNGGAITIQINPAAHCSIQASSVWGKVHTTLPIAVEAGGVEKRRMEGRLNGGGARMVIHADGGQVHIEAPRS